MFAPPSERGTIVYPGNAGGMHWDVPLGPETLGDVNLGGTLIAGDLVFIAVTREEVLRAFDIDTGREVWRATLPASAQAAPMT